MIRRLFWIVVAALVYWLLRRLGRGVVAERPPRPAPGEEGLALPVAHHRPLEAG